MDENNGQEEAETEYPPVKFTEEMQYYVYEAAKWARVLAIFGFLVSVIMILSSLASGQAFEVMSKSNPALSQVISGPQVLGFFYLLMAFMCLIPSVHLFLFAKNAKEGINFSTEEQLNTAFSKLKSYFKFCGILVIVIVALNILSAFLSAFGGMPK
ncbi:DUF5362 family protein [Hufsiella ginkgonis]|uniref:Uncharacterized protein n=1 Tax=Hufsiella ginkgonis TaxID=2695274 RepID=A0A7K1XZM4_9SPHI|nr:DUF5362 family protein [Hufsiella ginkgonis]MXV16402.1 hypothetical protein [Hufsiella ginkgonis]